MDLERGLLSGFLILGFALFLAGLLAGMLSFAVLGVTSDWSTLGFMIFALGFIVGMLTVALTFFMVRLSRMQKAS